jgi:hypothetical protein
MPVVEGQLVSFLSFPVFPQPAQPQTSSSLAMVQITVQHRPSSRPSLSRPSKPPVVIDFPHRHPNKVTVLELKGAIEAKFPKVSVPVSELPEGGIINGQRCWAGREEAEAQLKERRRDDVEAMASRRTRNPLQRARELSSWTPVHSRDILLAYSPVSQTSVAILARK